MVVVVVVVEEEGIDGLTMPKSSVGQMPTLDLGIVNSIPLIPGPFLPCDSQNHSGGM